MQIQSLGWEDPLEKGMATHSRILAWRIPWKEEPGGLQSIASQRVRRDWSSDVCSSDLERVRERRREKERGNKGRKEKRH